MSLVARAALISVAALTASGVMCGTSLAEQTTGGIYGRVYTQGSHAAACCLVVRVLSNTEPVQETRTHADGSFSFASVFPGDVTVVIGDEATPVDVHAGLETDARIVVSEAVAQLAH